MPVPLESAKMVSKEFSGVLMGGYNGTYPTSVMRELTCEFGTCFWRKMSQKLQEPRRDFVAMIIPDSLANCDNESWYTRKVSLGRVFPFIFFFVIMMT